MRVAYVRGDSLRVTDEVKERDGDDRRVVIIASCFESLKSRVE